VPVPLAKSDRDSDDDRDRLLPLALLSLVAGAITGLTGALFRLALNQANNFRDAVVDWSHTSTLARIAGFALLIMLCGTATALAAWLVRRFAPRASGSGIPHVEAVLSGELPPVPFWLIPVKFGGGVLAIGAGLALGREGPSIQIGASLAHLSGRIFRRNWADCRVLMAAGAGAGLATAFGAPIAGAVFVLEELVRRFETRIAVAALGASATAIAVARLLLGDAPEFDVAPLPYPGPQALALFAVLGLVAGLVAVAYNRAILGAIGLAQRLDRYPVELRAAAVGAAVGILAWLTPKLAGGGESLTQRTLDGQFAGAILAAVFALRFILGAVSYAARTPGGLFAPMLVVGAQLGLLFASIAALALPDLGAPINAFAVVGMAALFTGVVRAPVTGIVLITEMTASFTMLLPMLAACFAAMLIPTLIKNDPIYTTLRDLDRQQPTFPADRSGMPQE
jgi:CIC family chloride channel protein